MSEVPLQESDIVKPLANEENRTIPQTPERAYSLELHRANKTSSVNFISQTRQPLDYIFQTFQDPPQDIENRDTWVALRSGLGNIGKIYEPERDEYADREQYRMAVHSNSYATEDFRKYVLQPMEKLKIIPEAALKAFS
jgi:hypothetical protein